MLRDVLHWFLDRTVKIDREEKNKEINRLLYSTDAKIVLFDIYKKLGKKWLLTETQKYE